jgi:hypothetical protein
MMVLTIAAIIADLLPFRNNLNNSPIIPLLSRTFR